MDRVVVDVTLEREATGHDLLVAGVVVAGVVVAGVVVVGVVVAGAVVPGVVVAGVVVVGVGSSGSPQADKIRPINRTIAAIMHIVVFI